MGEPKQMTLGVVAAKLGEPIHVIEYIVRARNIRPVSRAGKLRVFDTEGFDEIKRQLATRPAQRAS